MTKIFSFDIFDTLITRKTATPAGIFLVMQYHLRNTRCSQFPVNLTEDFYRIRIDAENTAREECNDEETSFDEIYNKIQFRFNLTPSQLDFLKKLEIDTELENTIGIKNTISKVLELLDSGEKVILISDMYLGSEHIKQILKKTEPRLANCPVYVSSEQKASKQTGNLFKQIVKEYNIETSQLFHYGDNPHSDFRIPKKMGIHAELYTYRAVSEYEQIYFSEDRLYLQLLAGVSKNARLELSAAQSLERIGACYSGPLLYAYTEFVLQSALTRNLKKIYFLSRDGHILFQIARLINTKNKLNLDLQYIHVSRQVAYLASLFEITAKECTWIFEFMENLDTLAARFSINPDHLKMQVNRELSEPIGSTSTPLTEKQKREICQVLISNATLNSLLLSKAKDFRVLFLEYMRQNNVFSVSPFAMVDIGWSGKMQDSIYKTLSSQDSNIQMEYFYFGMYHSGVQKMTPYTSVKNQKHYFLESPMQVRTHATFFEVITSTNHGTTLSYERKEDGIISPVLAPFRASNNWDITACQNQILYFSEEFSSIISKFPYIRNYSYELAAELKMQSEKPIREIAETVGEFPFTLGHDEKHTEVLAPPVSLFQVLQWSLNRNKEFSNWLPGSLHRSSSLVRVFYNFLSTLRLTIRGLKSAAPQIKKSVKSWLKTMIYK